MESSVAEGYHVMKISHWIWLCLLDDVEIYMDPGGGNSVYIIATK